jgi:hypothetical protein
MIRLASLSAVTMVWSFIRPSQLVRKNTLLGRSSFLFQMKAPRRLPLDTSKRTICGRLLCCAVLDRMNCEFATTGPKHGKTLNCLATGPQMEIPQAVSRQVCPTDPDCVSFKTHGSNPAVRPGEDWRHLVFRSRRLNFPNGRRSARKRRQRVASHSMPLVAPPADSPSKFNAQ